MKIFFIILLFCFLILPLETLATAYSVSGTLSPDATTSNTGEPAGTYNGQPYWTWTNEGEVWFLFAALELPGFGWVYYICEELNTECSRYWENVSESVEGNYTSYNTQGTAIVTEYVPSNTAPTGTFNSATQSTNGTGNVSASVTINDADTNNVKAKVQYTTSATCTTGLTKATLIGTPTASVTPAPDLTQSNDYQIGTTTPILTTSANTVTFVWDSKTDLPNATGGTNYYLCLTANDGTVDQTAIGVSSAIAVDNTAPTNQDTVFATSTSKTGGASVTIVSSADSGSNVWFAPSGTTTFLAGDTMTTAGGTATTILAPVTAGAYRMFVIDAKGNISTQSTAILTVDNTAPTISNTASSLGSLGNTQTATISWTTDEASSTQVEYGATNSYGSSTTETDTTTRVTTHSLQLGLTPCQTYHARVISKDEASNQATGEDFTIQTQCAGGPSGSSSFSEQQNNTQQTQDQSQTQDQTQTQQQQQQDQEEQQKISLMEKIIELLKQIIEILILRKMGNF